MGVKVAFWDNYVACVRKAGVPETQVRWYVNCAERFARVLRDVPLRERAIEDVRLFLDDLRADERFAPWQVEQARQALRILDRDHLGIAPHQMPAKRSTTPRDQVRQPRQLDAVHGNLLKAMRDALRVRHYSPRTMEAYLGWVRRFIAFHALASPSDLGASHVREFLNYLAATKNVAASTQNQALNAVVFLYRDVLDRDPGDFSDFLRAKAPLRTPETLSREQIAALLSALEMPCRLMAILMYGAGLRVMECLQLRVHDLGLDEGTIHVHGKGAKDRTTLLPYAAVDLLKAHLAVVRQRFDQDRVHDPGLTWPDQYVFASEELRVDPQTRRVTRGHLNRNSVQNALTAAARRADLSANVTPHGLRHSFAAHAFSDGMHIRTVQELLGHARLSTTMLYTHPMNRPGKQPTRPLDPV